MNLEQYARQAQNAQQPQETQQAHPLDIAAARIDAERLYSLMAEARQIIADYKNPGTVLTMIAGAMFGEESAEAAAVAEMVEQDRNPGGREMTIAGLREQRRLLKQQLKKLDEQQKAIAEELTRLDEAERAEADEKAQTEAQAAALIDVLTFCKNLAPRENLLKEIQTLYQRHKENPAAMGLLYGSITEAARREYPAARFDLIQEQDYLSLKGQILAAAEGRKA